MFWVETITDKYSVMNHNYSQLTMSNALYSLMATEPQLSVAEMEPPAEMPNWMMAFLAIGIVLAFVWLIRRIVYPKKFSLANTPGRKNHLHPFHLLALAAAVVLLSVAATWLLMPLLPSAGRTLSEEVRLPAAPSVSADNVELKVAVSAVFHVIALVGGLMIAAMSFDRGIRRGMGLTMRHWRSGAIRGVVACLIALPACWGILWLTRQFMLRVGVKAEPGHMLLLAIREMSDPWRILICFMAIVLAPISEEIIFRGLVQSMVRSYTDRPWVAIITTSVLFGLMHLSVYSTIPALVVLAAVLGYNYERTGRLLSSIVAHAAFNAIFIVQAMTT